MDHTLVRYVIYPINFLIFLRNPEIILQSTPDNSNLQGKQKNVRVIEVKLYRK